MSKTLILTLLRIAQEGRGVQQATPAICALFDDFGIGYRSGKNYTLDERDRNRIKQYLANEKDIDWRTPLDAWNGISRDQALNLGSNEKMSDERTRDFRVAIKSLPGRPLLLGGQSMILPNGANLDLPWEYVASECGHDYLLLVENWTNFEKTHVTPLLSEITGNPLVLYRGDFVYGTKYSALLLKALGKPVVAFVDYDPAGLLIASALPGFQEMLCPPEQDLHSLLANCTNKGRFIRQKSENIGELQSLKHPQLKGLWATFDRYGVALPQEKLIHAA